MDPYFLATHLLVLSVDLLAIILLAVAQRYLQADLRLAFAAIITETLFRVAATLAGIYGYPAMHPATLVLQCVAVAMFYTALSQANNRPGAPVAIAGTGLSLAVLLMLFVVDAGSPGARAWLASLPLIALQVFVCVEAWRIEATIKLSRAAVTLFAVVILMVRILMPLFSETPLIYPTLFLFDGMLSAILVATLALFSLEVRSRRVDQLYRQRAAGMDVLQRMFDHLADVVVATDSDGRMIFWNQRAEALFGQPKEAVIGKRVIEDFVVEPERLEMAGLQNGTQITVLTGSDEERVVEVRREEVSGTDFARWLYVFREGVAPGHGDEDRYRIEQRLEQARKLESLGTLAAGIAHNFNNVLTSVIGNLTLARRELDSSDPARVYLERADAAINTATGLTNQILTFAKGGEPVSEPTDLVAVANSVADFQLEETRVTFATVTHGRPGLAHVDPAQIHQVFSSLMANARQAMPDGGELTMSFAAVEVPEETDDLERGEYVLVTVEDTGPGVDVRHAKRIFEPYFTTREDREGMGLAAAYSIVRRHGGQLRLAPGSGTGARFEIYLPAARQVAAPPVREPDQGAEIRARVLLLEDNDMNGRVAEHFLEELGCDVDRVTDGEAAVDAFREAFEQGHSIDVLLLDLNINDGMGGQEALELMKDIDPAVTAIVVSGHAYDPVMQEPEAFGFSGVLAKPYTFKQLEETIRAAVRGVKAQPAPF